MLGGYIHLHWSSLAQNSLSISADRLHTSRWVLSIRWNSYRYWISYLCGSATFQWINQWINLNLSFVGDIFRAERATVWEFDDRLPIRNIAIPYVFYGIPSVLLRLILHAISFQGTVSPYILLVFPRLMMCLMSFCVDLSLIRYSIKDLHSVTFSNKFSLHIPSWYHFGELRFWYCFWW